MPRLNTSSSSFLFPCFPITVPAQRPPLRARDYNAELLNLDDHSHIFAISGRPVMRSLKTHVLREIENLMLGGRDVISSAS